MALLAVSNAYAAGSDIQKIQQEGIQVPGIPVEVVSQLKARVKKNDAAKQEVKKEPTSPSVATRIEHTLMGNAKAAEVAKPQPQQRPNVTAKLIPTSNQANSQPQPTGFESRLRIQVQPGVNEIIKISKGHLNRITTPFEHVAVDTISQATFEVKGPNVLVTSNQDGPVTMFLHERDDNGLAISVTLLPQAIPPRDIQLVFQGMPYNMMARKMTVKAGRWEKERPYTDTIKLSMVALANGSVPEGYSLRKILPLDRKIDCHAKIQGVTINFGQVLEGHDIIYQVGAVKNVSKGAIELRESFCYQDGILAVAFWPKVRLAPNEETEVYVGYKRPSDIIQNLRPRMTGE